MQLSSVGWFEPGQEEATRLDCEKFAKTLRESSRRWHGRAGYGVRAPATYARKRIACAHPVRILQPSSPQKPHTEVYDLLTHTQLSPTLTGLKDKPRPLMFGATIRRLIGTTMASHDRELMNDLTGELQFAMGTRGSKRCWTSADSWRCSSSKRSVLSTTCLARA